MKSLTLLALLTLNLNLASCKQRSFNPESQPNLVTGTGSRNQDGDGYSYHSLNQYGSKFLCFFKMNTGNRGFLIVEDGFECYKDRNLDQFLNRALFVDLVTEPIKVQHEFPNLFPDYFNYKYKLIYKGREMGTILQEGGYGTVLDHHMFTKFVKYDLCPGTLCTLDLSTNVPTLTF